MGMNFHAYLSHSLNQQDLLNYCNELNCKNHKFIETFIEELLPYNPEDINKEWKLRFDDFNGTYELDGPCGLGFTFSEKVCMVSHYTRWLTFLLNDLDFDFQKQLRNVSYELMNKMESDYVIYVPDSGAIESAIMDFMWEDENKDIEYMKDWLLRKCGEPKEHIIDIYNDLGDSWDSKGYYIDLFTDYRNV
ncbi:hypothetical protein [Paenibacillus sp. YIM B09110]|uniref:hypothetical protein n=1 Tax=Paenibacillus sp. YIM B09110 TaxID=3126102 RepID=UPI00301BB7F8